MIIYKYPLNKAVTRLDIPAGGKILTAQLQGDRIVLWAQIDETQFNDDSYYVYLMFTGEKFQSTTIDPSATYLATVQDTDGLVYHVYYERVM